ncbi:ATP-binding protein [Aestuariicoccus sp. MJ-SS9]|uniref:hybrid sensor histidine kinase/response regulator n=1 Tax=Aestuariicoccus sp. MJ-SS9 TaxID=3079855 RepID=UPI002911D58C|nr:ATP-binding protein [Aestuariicoccus sp. MJ-SS9]MDU8912646.1 ATP-binding protein [Aestuariicoccus sp. MJ-SS9]
MMRRKGVLFALALLCLGLAMLAPGLAAQLGFLTAAATIATVAVGLTAWSLVTRAQGKTDFALVTQLLEGEATPAAVTDCDGRIRFANIAARDALSLRTGEPLASALDGHFASPAAIVFRLQLRASENGIAVEDVAGPRGTACIRVQQLDGETVVWRLTLPGQAGQGPDKGKQHPILTLGRRGAVLYMNEQARNLLGKRPRNIAEAIEEERISPGDIHNVHTPDGTRRYLIHVGEAGAGREELLFEAVGDATLKPADKTEFDSLPVPLLKVNPSGEVLRANREARQLLDTEITPRLTMGDLMEGLGRSISDWLTDAAAGRGLNRSEFLRLSRTDREMFVQVTLNRVIEDGQPLLVAVLNDATELKTLEAQFVQSQKMQAIGQLAGGVAHDFNNLLNAISGHCDLMLLRHDQGDPDYGDLVQINQNANRAAALVSQLLAFSRKQTLRPEVLDLRDTLADLTHLLNRLVGERVKLKLSHEPVLPAIRGDKRQLEQVMMNLVVNARDAMPNGGSVLIETERAVLREPFRRDRAVVAPGTYVTVKVTDEGVGIHKDQLQKVFEPFFTTKPTGEGTGLGLSTVYGIVKQTGGFIFVDSVVGKGTCFTLMFPAFEEAAPEETAKPVKETPAITRNGEGVVLLVEDEAPVRAFAARALRLRGYTVIEAESAEEALSLLDDGTLEVDVFVTDVVMPGMDGPTWVREALVKRPEVRVVFMSGYAEDAFGEGQDRPVDSVFLPKPFSLNELTDVVHAQFA